MVSIGDKELKIEGAIEAARDPNTSASAKDVERKIVEDSRAAGVTAFTFDPDAPIEQKRAQARAALPEGLPKRPKGIALVTDMEDEEDCKPTVDLPPPTKEGAIQAGKDEENGLANGQMGGQEEEEFSRTGWAPRFGWPADPEGPEGESLLEHTTWLESQLPDTLYGDWYHNTAIIVFACLASWLVAVLGGGLAWVFIVMSICATYYRTSIRRVRRNFRDDMTREAALRRLDEPGGEETTEWINNFLLKFWPIYQPVLAQTIINSVDQVLSASTPAFLDSLKLKTFTLGSKPPRIISVKTYPKEADDVVVMDWTFSFNPNDTADMTTLQIKNKINPKVVLEIRVGKAMISKGLDVIVADMSFEGAMRIKMKLQIPFPHMEKVEMCFLSPPKLDYVCKPLGGETFGFDINFIPFLETFIQDQIHATLKPMMYMPNVFPIEVAKMLAGTPVDQAVGVIAVTLHGCHGLKNPDKFSGTPDPYAKISLSRRETLAQTKVVKENSNPRWNETHYVIISSFHESLDIEIFDYNDFRKDKELGAATFALEALEEEPEHGNQRLEVIHDGKARGILSADIRFFPILEAHTLPDGSLEQIPETNTGILRFTVEQAKDLDGTKSLLGLLNPYATLLLNGKEVHSTKKLKRTNNPIWDNGSKEILITDRKSAKLGVIIKDDRDLAGDQVIGSYQIKLDDMLELGAKGQEWYNLSGVKTGRAKMVAQWKPVAISGVTVGTGGYVTPVGVLRIHFKGAKDLRNLEAVGKSDPYARVLLSGIEKGRTVTFKNNLNPEWDEVLYVPIHSARERLELEVMDSENMGRDRSLGQTEIFSGDFMSQDENGEWLVHDKKAARSDGLRLQGKGVPKGLLHFTVAFYPALNIADPEDEGDDKKKEGTEAPPGPDTSVEMARSGHAGTFSASREKEPTTPLDAKSPIIPTTPLSARKTREEKQAAKLHLTPEQLLKHDSGLVIFKLMDAHLPKSHSRIEVYVDDMAFPSYVSSIARTKDHRFEELGDCFIRELDFSKLTIKMCERGDKQEESGKQHTLAHLTGNTLDTLKQCMNNPTMLKLKSDMKDEDEHKDRSAWVKLSLKYLPVKMQLDPSESINNMGNLRVDVLDAADLPSADANGKSDPYVKFELNGQEVFKTKTVKKTLHPVWDEFFEVAVTSRTAARFKAVVWDWDFADKPDYLGGADINLEMLDPFRPQEVRLKLDGKSGTLRLRLLFRPDYVTRTRQGTSAFSGTFAVPGRIVTGVAGAPVKGITGVAHGVGKGASFIKRGFRSSTNRKGEESDSPRPSSSTTAEVPLITTNGPDEPPNLGLMSSPMAGIGEGDGSPPSSPGPAVGSPSRNHGRSRSVGASSIHSAIVPGAASGTAGFTVLSAAGYAQGTDLYVVITQLRDGKAKTIGKTKHHKIHGDALRLDETFKVSCTPDAQFKIEVKHHHTFGSDDDLGDSLYFVDDSNSGQEKQINVGSGSVVIKSWFTPSESNLAVGTESPKSVNGHGVRRSLLGKRESRNPSRDSSAGL